MEWKTVFILGVAVLSLGLFLAGCGGEDSTGATSDSYSMDLTGVPASFDTTGTLELTVSGTDLTGYRYKINDDLSWTEVSDPAQKISVTAEGMYMIKIVGRDKKGAWRNESAPVLARFMIGTPDGTATKPFLIRNITGLQNITDLTKHYALANDIDASDTKTWNSGAGFVPLGGTFTGSFNGNCFVIKNLYISREGDRQALFSSVGTTGVLKNIYLENVDISNVLSGAGLVGYNLGKISGCRVSGKVRGTKTGIYNDCLGGLVGDNYGNFEISDCYSSVEVTSEHTSGENVGGLVGRAGAGKITNCHSDGAVKGSWSVGGLVGQNNGEITGCSATGDVTVLDNGGGGLAGKNSGKITLCYATGDVINETPNAPQGGLVGSSGGAGIENCYARGKLAVSSNNGNGGFIGLVTDYYPISYCYETVTLKSGSYPFAGYDSVPNAALTSCYQEWTVHGACSAKIAGTLTTAEMKTKTGFPGWDFDTVWAIDPSINDGYPYLRSNPPR